MSATVQPAVSDEVIVYQQATRRSSCSCCCSRSRSGCAGWVITSLNLYGELPQNLIPVTALWYGMGVAAHLVVRFRLPYADPVILPSVFLLNGLGLAMISRIDQIPEPVNDDAATQLLWTALGLIAVRRRRVPACGTTAACSATPTCCSSPASYSCCCRCCR